MQIVQLEDQTMTKHESNNFASCQRRLLYNLLGLPGIHNFIWKILPGPLKKKQSKNIIDPSPHLIIGIRFFPLSSSLFLQDFGFLESIILWNHSTLTQLKI